MTHYGLSWITAQISCANYFSMPVIYAVN